MIFTHNTFFLLTRINSKDRFLSVAVGYFDDEVNQRTSLTGTRFLGDRNWFIRLDSYRYHCIVFYYIKYLRNDTDNCQ